MSTNQFAAEPELVDPTIAELTAEPVVEEELETTEDQDESESDTELEEVDDSDEDLEKEFEQVESAKTALESYVQLLKQVGPEGISRQTTAILNLGLKHTYAQLGLQLPTTGLEDYANGSLVMVSLEELEEKKKGILARLWELILKGLRAVGDFFKKVFSKAEKVKEKAEEVKEKAKDSKIVSGTEFEIPETLAKWIWKSVDVDQTMEVTMKPELEAINLVTQVLPGVVLDMIDDTLKDIEPSGDGMIKIFKELKPLTFSNGTVVEVTGSSDDLKLEVNVIDEPKLITKLKTRSPHEIHKNVVIIEELMDKFIKAPDEGVMKVLDRLELLSKDVAETRKSEFIQDALTVIKKSLDGTIDKIIASTVMNIANAKLNVMLLELATSKEDNPE